MISYLVDAVLLVALAITSVKMVTMYRELRRLGSYHADYQRVFDQTSLALDGIEVSIQEINVRGSQVLNALGSRMDDARDLIAEIDGLIREAKRQQSVLKAELKQLSAELAVRPSADRFASSDSDPAGAQGKEAARRNDPLLASAPTATEVRVHRIDDMPTGPFRSVSMHRKDDLT